jgi:hypothetical protein
MKTTINANVDSLRKRELGSRGKANGCQGRKRTSRQTKAAGVESPAAGRKAWEVPQALIEWHRSPASPFVEATVSPIFLPKVPLMKAAQRMRLPAGRFEQFLSGSSARPLQ